MKADRLNRNLLAGVVLTAALALSAAVQAAGPSDVMIEDGQIKQSLTGQPGDPANGRKVAINRKQGNCLACHTMPVPEQQYHGEIGPDLNGVAGRLSEGELRLRVVNAKAAIPGSFMPAFYRTDGLHRVLKGFQGKTILTAQQVEDVVAYLKTLK